jgi:hypothetical protein
MFDYDRKERTSWGLTLTQPSTTLSRPGGSFSFVKPRRATTGRRTGPLIARFSDDLVSRLNKQRHKLPAQFGS